MGAQTGTCIGTVRAFRRSLIEATTDSLTGLLNRLSLEARLRLRAMWSNTQRPSI